MPALPSFLPRFYRPSSRSGPHEHHPFSFKDVARSYGPDWALAVCLWFFLGWLNHVEGYKREFSVEHDIRCVRCERFPGRACWRALEQGDVGSRPPALSPSPCLARVLAQADPSFRLCLPASSTPLPSSALCRAAC